MRSASKLKKEPGGRPCRTAARTPSDRHQDAARQQAQAAADAPAASLRGVLAVPDNQQKTISRGARNKADRYIVGETLSLTRAQGGAFWTVISEFREGARCYANVRPASEEERAALLGERQRRGMRDRAEAALLQRMRVRGEERRDEGQGGEAVPIGKGLGTIWIQSDKLVYVRPGEPPLCCRRLPEIEALLADLRALW